MSLLRQVAHLCDTEATMRATSELTLTFGERLAKARRLANLTQTEMADRLGIGRRSISRYEDDAVPPNRGICIAWAVITEVPVEWLETGTVTDPDGGTVTLRHWFGNEGDIPSLDRRYPWSDHQMSFNLIAS